MGTRIQVVEHADLGGAEGAGLGEHAGRLRGDVERLREGDERGNRIEVVLRVEQLVVEGERIDHGLDVGRRAAGGGDPHLLALLFGEDLREFGLHPVGRHGGALVGSTHDHGDCVLLRRVALEERLRAGRVEGGVVGDEVGGDLDDVGGGGRTVEGRGEHAVEGRDPIAARVEHDTALHAETAGERLGGVEGAGAGAEHGRIGGVGFPDCRIGGFQEPKGVDAEVVEEVGERLVERTSEVDFNEVEVAAKGAGEGLGLVFVSGLAVGENEGFVHFAVSISFTALRIRRFATAMPPLIVQPAARMCPPPPKRVARRVASQGARVRMETRVSCVRSGI